MARRRDQRSVRAHPLSPEGRADCARALAASADVSPLRQVAGKVTAMLDESRRARRSAVASVVVWCATAGLLACLALAGCSPGPTETRGASSARTAAEGYLSAVASGDSVEASRLSVKAMTADETESMRESVFGSDRPLEIRSVALTEHSAVGTGDASGTDRTLFTMEGWVAAAGDAPQYVSATTWIMTKRLPRGWVVVGVERSAAVPINPP